MKKVLLGVGIVVVGAGLFELGRISRGEGDKVPAAPSGAPVASVAPGNPGANPPPPATQRSFISQSDFRRLLTARDAVMQANPDLAAEYKAIISAMQDQQKELDDAMIKADPKVAPLIAKLVVLRQRSQTHAPTAMQGPR